MKRIQYDHLHNSYLISDKDMKDFDRLCKLMAKGDEEAMEEFVDKYGKFQFTSVEDE